MPKQKTNKSMLKRIKISGNGKLLRRHQMGTGHLKRKKSKTALNRQKKNSVYFVGEARRIRKAIGL